MKSIRVVLAEDHVTVRDGIRLLIEAEPDMEVVAAVPDGRRVVEAVAAAPPDVAVIDLSMPAGSGLSAARTLRRQWAAVAIVALTRHDDSAFVKELLDAGASGPR